MEKQQKIKKWLNKIHIGDWVKVMEKMPSGVVQCVITSPPYW